MTRPHMTPSAVESFAPQPLQEPECLKGRHFLLPSTSTWSGTAPTLHSHGDPEPEITEIGLVELDPISLRLFREANKLVRGSK
jgi:hypothetical protein